MGDDRNNTNAKLWGTLLIFVCLSVFITSVGLGMYFEYKEKTEPVIVSYNEFLGYARNGEIDTLWYSTNEEYMKFVLFNDETRTMTVKEREDYKYTKDMYMKCLYPASSDFREKMLLYGVNMVLVDSTGTIISVASLIITILFNICFIFLMIRFIKMMTKQLNIGGTNSTFEKINHSDIRFSDVIGHDEVIQDLKFIVKLLQNPNLGEKANARVPKGILFTGAPGTGKTLIAKALAGEANVPFMYMNASNFIEMYVGMGAKRVRELFKEARKNAPCIVFLDEIDSIGCSRNTSQQTTTEHLQTINALLQEMDGFDTKTGVIVIAATNNSQVLDKALTRSGRFDREIIIPEPRKWETRFDLFKHFTLRLCMNDDVNLEQLAKETSGFTGADIQSVCNEAALIALSDKLGCRDKVPVYNKVKDFDVIVSMSNFEEAIDKKMLKGNRKRDTEEESKDRKLVAYHEAGHAVVSWLQNKPIARTTIIGSTSGVGGFVMHSDADDTVFKTKKDFENDIIIAYSGRAAEEIIFGKDCVTTGASSDIENATKSLRAYVEIYGFSTELGLLDFNTLHRDGLIDNELICNKLKELSKKYYSDALDILGKNRSYLDILAKVLLKCENLSGEQINDLFNQCNDEDFNIDRFCEDIKEVAV